MIYRTRIGSPTFEVAVTATLNVGESVPVRSVGCPRAFRSSSRGSVTPRSWSSSPASRLLTDPVLTTRVAHLRRHGAVTTDVLRGVDAVLISHVHLDHLHIPSLAAADADAGCRRARRSRRRCSPSAASPTFARPAAATTTHRDRRGRHRAGRHGDRRGPHSRVTAAAVGYVVRSAGRAVYFAGDTDLFAEMSTLAPVDVALLPIWGWGPTLGERAPRSRRAAEAVRAARRPRSSCPIHWGTYSPSIVRRRPPAWLARPVDRFRAELDRHRPRSTVSACWRPASD